MAAEEKYTSKEYLKNNPTWHVEDSPWKARQILKIIEKNGLNPNSIAEVGCGAGEILRQMFLQMNNNISFAGYEISPHAFELCGQRTSDRLEYKLENLLEKNGVHYSIVMAIDVMEHVEDYFGFLRNIRKKGEYKIFHIPLDMTVQTVFRMSPILKIREKVGHIHYFLKDTALAALKDTGYEIIDWFYTPGALDLSGRTFKAKLLKMPRKIGFKINRDLTVRLLGGYSLMVLAK
jgi:2-polyprenyl-3-methyl-5-hydroxy-6-metoxy-1,4-benzoquinol methylase